MQVDGNDVLNKFEELYPTEFRLCVAEVKCNMLEKKVEYLENELASHVGPES